MYLRIVHFHKNTFYLRFVACVDWTSWSKRKTSVLWSLSLSLLWWFFPFVLSLNIRTHTTNNFFFNIKKNEIFIQWSRQMKLNRFFFDSFPDISNISVWIVVATSQSIFVFYSSIVNVGKRHCATVLFIELLRITSHRIEKNVM